MSLKTYNFIIITTLSLIFNAYFAQSNQSKFVQFVFTNLETREKAIEIDKFMRQQEGVSMSRADFISKKYLVIFDEKSGITLSKIEIWMQQLGLEFICPREGIHGKDTIINQTIDCGK